MMVRCSRLRSMTRSRISRRACGSRPVEGSSRNSVCGSLSNASASASRCFSQLNNPSGVAVGPSGVIYIADTLNQRVRAIAPGGILSTLAGNGVAGFNGDIQLPKTALLNRPLGVAADALGDWFVAVTVNSRVRQAQPGGNLFTIAGNGNAS